MTLPSQQPTTSSNASPSRRSGGQTAGIIAAILLLGGAGAYWVITSRESAKKPEGTLPPANVASLGGSNVPNDATSAPGSLTNAISNLKTPVISPTPGANGEGAAPAGPTDGSPLPSNAIIDPNATKPIEPGPTTTAPIVPAPEAVRDALSWTAEGDKKLAANDLVGARFAFSRALADARTTGSDADSLRGKLAQINMDLIFSPKVFPGEGFSEQYAVVGGDSLVRIARSRDLATDWRFIQRVNKISDPGMLKVGQKLKLVRGPFNAIVHSDDFRLDLYAGAPDDQASWVFVRSFKVGTGESGSTPTGDFVVKRGSRLINPHWANPRTGEQFDADDPKNPIGERWIGLEGVGNSAVHVGYGLHGTIDPDSIGQMKSMGCVRLGADDIELLYEMLVDRVSVVKIVK